MSLTTGEVPEGNPTISVDFKIAQLSVSGLKINRLDMYGEVSLCCCCMAIVCDSLSLSACNLSEKCVFSQLKCVFCRRLKGSDVLVYLGDVFRSVIAFR